MKRFIFVLLLLVYGIYATPFKFTIQTDSTGTSNDSSFTLPLPSAYTFNFDIDWGDDSVQTVTTNTPITHEYTDGPGEYEISITENVSGGFYMLQFNNGAGGGGDRLKVKAITQWGTNKWMRLEAAFRGCTNMKITATDADSIDFTSVTNADYAFQGTAIDSFPAVNMPALIVMNSMFRDCTQMTKYRSPTLTPGNVIQAQYTWTNTRIDSMPAIDLSGVSSFAYTWQYCYSMVYFDSGVVMTAMTNGYATFMSCTSLVNYIDNVPYDNLTDGQNMYYGCTNITQRFTHDLPELLSGFRMFINNHRSAGFDSINIAKATGLREAWEGCSTYTTFPNLQFLACTNLDRAWMACVGLDGSIELYAPVVQSMRYTYRGCTDVDSFKVMYHPNCTDFFETFVECHDAVYYDPDSDYSNGTNFNWFLHENKSLEYYPSFDFSNAESCKVMFGHLPSIKSFKSHDFPAMVYGLDFFSNCSIPSEDYTEILINLRKNNTNTGVTFGAASSKYLWKAENDRDTMIINRSWTITDGGLDPDSGTISIDSICLPEFMLYGDFGAATDSIYVDSVKATISGATADSVLVEPANNFCAGAHTIQVWISGVEYWQLFNLYDMLGTGKLYFFFGED